MTVFLDVNLFIYAAGGEHPFKAPSVRLIDQVANGSVEAVADAEVVQELVYRYWRRGALDQGLRLCDQVLRVVPTMLPIEKADLVLMRKLLETHRTIEPRDAMHAAVMLNHGITHLYSYDRHFDAIPGLTRLEP
jgi:predicted nucleic acid-binding protein